ncbi:MAG: A/G-specific adenine glycosylase [Gammaproteobacteria bacterium]
MPWKREPTPYSVWVSEIMLQQTQVSTVIPYFERFLQRFPDVNSLAAAALDEVLHHWSGLGYYARARHLSRAARFIVERRGGVFPKGIEELAALPGIGRSTAGAILALAFDQRHPILDGNVKRVLTRFCGIVENPDRSPVQRRLWAIADHLTPERKVASYTQAMMDLGATICTRANPQCPRCPVSNDCKAYALGRPEDFPGRREKKALPVRHALLAILQNPAGEILLQRRPPVGVWGGLWSFPQCPDDERFSEWCATEFALEVLDQKNGEILRHRFSHFRLDIAPVFARVRAVGWGVMEAKDTLWYNVGSPLAVGLAAPVRSLLSRLYFNVNCKRSKCREW